MKEGALRSPSQARTGSALARRDGRSPYQRYGLSPKKRIAITHGLEVGPLLPKLSPEQETRLQHQLLPGRSETFIDSKMTIAQIRQHSRDELKKQTDVARLVTEGLYADTSNRTKRLRDAPIVPAQITEIQRARGRLMRYISLYENEYREEILSHMYKMQECTMPSRTAMEQQTDIQIHMRKSLLDFMIELHTVFHLRQETLYLAINIIDRYCSIRLVQRKNFQLIGCCALFIAAKYEDSKDHTPNTTDLKQYCRDVYEELAFRQMEGHILETLNWELGHPTCEAWFRCMVNTLDKSGSDAAKEMAIRQGWAGLEELEKYGTPVIMADLATQCIARYLMELMIYQEALLDVPPCVIAEAALILAKVVSWGTRERRNESAAAMHVVRYLHLLLCGSLEWISDAVYNKYKDAQYDGASLKVSHYYLKWTQEDCLELLEEIPDVSDKSAMARMAEEAKAKAEAEREAAEQARYQRVTIILAANDGGEREPEEEEEPDNDDEFEEVPLHGDIAPATIAFSDSGYGSFGEASPAKNSGSSPLPQPSPARSTHDETVPPLRLPRSF